MQLSIIIPCYNLENYIGRCLESCLAQDFEDYEIICVNDGSTDKTREILDEYSKKSSKIKVLHKENGGVSSARNSGIELSSGKWIWFIDGDDWIEKDIIATLNSKINGDFLQFNIEKAYDVEDETFNVCDKQNSKSVKVNDVLYGNLYLVSFWYQREIIESNKIRFNKEMHIMEDIKFVMEYLQFCQSGVHFECNVYKYFQRQNSAVHTIKDRQNYLFCLKLMIETTNKCALSREDSSSGYYNIRDSYTRLYMFNLFLYAKRFDFAKDELNWLIKNGFYPYDKQKSSLGRNKKERFCKFLQNQFRKKFIFISAVRLRTWLKRVK